MSLGPNNTSGISTPAWNKAYLDAQKSGKSPAEATNAATAAANTVNQNINALTSKDGSATTRQIVDSITPGYHAIQYKPSPSPPPPPAPSAPSTGMQGVHGYDPMNPGVYENWYREHAGDFNPVNINGYYDDAEARQRAQINQAAAARGSWMSSNTMGMQSNALSQLEGQRAQALDSSKRAWLQAGGSAAANAQNFGSTRWGQEFNALNTVGGEIGTALNNGYNGMFSTDQGLYTDAVNAATGAANTNAANTAATNAQNTANNALLTQAITNTTRGSGGNANTTATSWGTGPTGGSTGDGSSWGAQAVNMPGSYSTNGWGGGWNTSSASSAPSSGYDPYGWNGGNP